LVVLNGDLITGENTYYHNSTKYLDIVAAPMVQRGIPWASTYGNHDSGYNLSTAKLLATEQKYKLSFTRDMIGNPDAETTNYVLPVFGKRADFTPELLLWFFDSRGGSKYQKQEGIEGFVHDLVCCPFYSKENYCSYIRQQGGFEIRTGHCG
jgi:hypothetical protein